jgi:hypothetical protein
METSNRLRGKEGAVASQVLGNPDELLYLFQGEYPLYADFLVLGIIFALYSLPESVRCYS